MDNTYHTELYWKTTERDKKKTVVRLQLAAFKATVKANQGGGGVQSHSVCVMHMRGKVDGVCCAASSSFAIAPCSSLAAEHEVKTSC